MSVLDMWSVCDDCGFNYKRRAMRKQSTGFVVCETCYDGKFDRKSHPQNKSFRPRRESRPVPDGRAQQSLVAYLATENGALLLTEDGNQILVTNVVWNPSMSLPR